MPDGHLWIAYLIAVTKIGDIAAYFIGSLWGRHSLIPHISPKKSVEGTLAGLSASVLVSAAFAGHLPVAFGAWQLAGIGLVTGIVAQCGDLSESLIKRYCGAKDSSRTIPGFGGLLDVMDSVLFTAPLFYFFLNGAAS
jgi:phosphatidate cytidylyltransferase